MADFQLIKQEIDDNVNTNGVGAITGAILNETLKDLVDAVNAAKADVLPEGSVFGDFALPDTPPTYGDDHQFYYIAKQSGTYEYYNNIQLDGRFFTMLFWNGSQWDFSPLSYTPNGLSEELQYYLRIQYLYQHLGFSTFSTSETYHAGDMVVYNGVLYKFNNDHTGAWDDDDVDATDLFNELNGKQDTISDLSTIRSGAEAGATAVQPSDLATVATSGSYNDLLNKPTIPAAQVQSDWNEADNTKVDYIKNKPTIPNVSGKADKVVGANSGDVATLDGNGNLTDSGLSVFDFFVMVEDASTPPASMAPNTVYQYGTLSGNTTFPALATPTEPDIANVYCWTFATPSTAPTITWPVAITDWAGGSAPTINASKKYEVSVMDGVATIIEA